jgi:hypothetical protein
MGLGGSCNEVAVGALGDLGVTVDVLGIDLRVGVDDVRRIDLEQRLGSAGPVAFGRLLSIGIEERAVSRMGHHRRFCKLKSWN